MQKGSHLMLITMVFISCTQNPNPFFNLQGHRGARGLYPENTVPGFLAAIDLGVNTLEMDVVVTGDGQLLVSHEPYISAEICLNQNDSIIPEDSAKKLNIYEMSYEEVKSYDCGTKFHPRFPDQRKMKTSKPLFSSVFDTVERYVKKHDLTAPGYNIEIKSQQQTDDIYHPEPSIFSDMLYKALDGKIDWERVTIQSFDFRVLQYFHQKYPKVRLALLIENRLPFEANLDSLGFKPDIYSCHYELLNPEVIESLQSQGIKVVPWTINDAQEMQRLKKLGVDGLITDYPDRFTNQ